MLTYLNQSYNEYEQRQLEQGKALTKDGVSRAVMEGAGLRVRPVMMTAVSTIAGLLPIMFTICGERKTLRLDDTLLCKYHLRTFDLDQ